MYCISPEFLPCIDKPFINVKLHADTTETDHLQTILGEF